MLDGMLTFASGSPALWLLMGLYWATSLGFGLWLSITDLRWHRLPNTVVAAWLGASALLLLLMALVAGEPKRLLYAGAGMLILLGAYLLLHVLTRGAMGMGDVKLAGALGFNLGFFALSALFLATVLAFVTATFMVLIGVAVRKLSMSSRVAFGPFMILGAVIALAMTG